MHSNVSIEYKYQEAVTLYNNGCLYEAEQLLTELSKTDNTDYDIFNFLGIINLTTGKYVRAKELFEKVLSLCSYHKEAYYNLGLCCQHLNDFNNALTYYDKALTADFNNSPALINSGIIYLELKEYEKAEFCFNCSLTIEKDNPLIYNNLANLALLRNNPEAAVFNYKKAIDIDSDCALYYYNLGIAFEKLNDQNCAKECFEKAVLLNPLYTEALYRLISICTSQNDFKKADEYLLKVNTSSYSKALSSTNKGVEKLRQGLLFDAIGYLNEALKYEPEHPEIHYSKFHALMLLGNFEEGLKEYEYRLKRENFPAKKTIKPLPENIDLAGTKILVRDEQGLGDSIQFIRLIELLKEKGAITFFECDSRLIPLFNQCTFIDELIPREKEAEIAFDYDIHLLSLLHYFRITKESVPAKAPYLFPGEEYIKKWEQVIDQKSPLKIGIVWAGNPKHPNDEKRSCKLKDMLPLFDLESAEYYVLQKGTAVSELEESQYPLKRVDHYNKSFEDAAAAISLLDLVITVDTSIAHLAGALGKETWLLLPFLPDWRWMLKTSDTPWYPTFKIYRQDNPGDWSSVISNIKEDLKSRLMQTNSESTSAYNCPNSDIVKHDQNIYLGLSQTGNFGWGVVCKYLKEELSKKTSAIDLSENKELQEISFLEGKVIHLLTNQNFNSLYSVRGRINIGHTAFENELTPASLKNARDYDLVLAASTWGKQKMIDYGIRNADALIQGIDPTLFYPGENTASQNLFVIFSGGKFEFRKGQDLVLKAIKILQQKYSDIVLVNAWYNLWPQVLQNMKNSKHINFELKGDTWEEIMLHIYNINNIDHKRVITLPLLPNNKLRELYLKTDIGLFPNRCEGGTNLVMMEYMACGKPVIASFNSGHMDIVNEQNAMLLKESKEVRLFSSQGLLESDWSEPTVDEIIHRIEIAYHNRHLLSPIGMNAAQSMMNFTWEKTAEKLLLFLDRYN